ncbi:MAG: hypothetical protein COS37_04265 [Anaerolineae bacterium CG03_land_8_20_14_0_80_58_20]|nr:MAG: hypothetical protein AUJ21_07960 [Anaerolineae bacterium CG1_02_58_13]PIV26852.1 MAG: hypothetical protein COS37_04265 [Anaerolineae bacterium CG03_land_8_20_14_0_80_58_20]
MTEVKRPSLLKPTIRTPFQIDFEWWKESERDWQVYLRSLLCPAHQESLANLEDGQMIDWVEENTAEVREVDGIQHALMSHCARQEDFVTQKTALVEAVFRLFLANGNQPMSAEDLSARMGRPANTILTTLAGPRVYKGLRPAQ